MNARFLLMRLLGRPTAVLAPGAVLHASASIKNARRSSEFIAIGANTIVKGELFVFAHGGEISIGEWCYVGEGTRVWSAERIRIGNRVLLSHNVNVFDSLTHPLAPSARHAQFRSIALRGHPASIDLGERPVYISDDVLVGAGATILRGVTVGSGAVVAAGAVVTRDVEAFTIVAGNPARAVRSLTDEERA